MLIAGVHGAIKFHCSGRCASDSMLCPPLLILRDRPLQPHPRLRLYETLKHQPDRYYSPE
jgi:hypothetical protein